MTPVKYAEKIVKDFMRDITDHIFLNIQHDEKLMRKYQTCVNESSLKEVNTTIGKEVKKLFDLENDDECNTPRSWLIKSYTKHKKRQK